MYDIPINIPPINTYCLLRPHFDLVLSGIESLFKNFPDFEQNNTRIAVFGKNTAKAATDAGLNINIEAPLPKVRSMSEALDLYIGKANKAKS